MPCFVHPAVLQQKMGGICVSTFHMSKWGNAYLRRQPHGKAFLSAVEYRQLNSETNTAIQKPKIRDSETKFPRFRNYNSAIQKPTSNQKTTIQQPNAQLVRWGGGMGLG